MSREAMKLALEALEKTALIFGDDSLSSKAAAALREALAEQPYEIGTRLAREGKGISDLWGAVKSDADMAEAQRGYEAALAEQPAQQEPVAWQPLPCPFCGHIGLDFADGETYRWGVASCGGCGASCGDVRREYPDKGEWHTEAIAEWNRRSPAAQRTWVGLNDTDLDVCGNEDDVLLARYWERVCKEKNA